LDGEKELAKLEDCPQVDISLGLSVKGYGKYVATLLDQLSDLALLKVVIYYHRYGRGEHSEVLIIASLEVAQNPFPAIIIKKVSKASYTLTANRDLFILHSDVKLLMLHHQKFELTVCGFVVVCGWKIYLCHILQV
jgi:hypothetical protein